MDCSILVGLTDKGVIECCAMPDDKMSWMVGDGEIAQKSVKFYTDHFY